MTHIQQRRDTFANWTLVNPVLMDGEAGHEKDTGRWKLGDGVTPYIDLPYKSSVDSVAGRTGDVTLTVGDVSGAAPLASPTFTGAPAAPTPNPAEDSTRIATTAWARDVFAPLDSPALIGNPTAPTPATADNDTSIATTAFVKAQAYAPLDSPALTGNPTAPTPSTTDNDTSVATTAFVKSAVAKANTWIPYGPLTMPDGGGAFNNVNIARGLYCRSGDVTHFTVEVRIADKGSATGTLLIGLPVSAAAIGWAQIVSGRENESTGSSLQGIINTGQPWITALTYNNQGVIESNRTFVFAGTYCSAPL